MTFETWLVYVATVLVITLTPGPSILVGMVHGLTHGPRRAVATALGDISANMIQMLIAAVGLGALMATSAEAFALVKWAGVAYLMFLGVVTWRKAPSGRRGTEERGRSLGGLYAQGFAVAATNPKAIVFFGALFPQFLDPAVALWPQVLVLGVTFAVLDFSCVMAYATGAHRIAPWFEKRGGERTLNRLSGAMMFGAGALLATVRRI